MISKLSLEDENTIASMLAAYFHDHNSHLGKSYFKEDEAVMKKHVHERLATDGSIQYVGWVDENELRGFINFYDNKEARTIEVWAVVGPDLTQEQISALLEYCKQMVEQKGYKGMSMDIADHERLTQSAFTALGGRKKTNNYVM